MTNIGDFNLKDLRVDLTNRTNGVILKPLTNDYQKLKNDLGFYQIQMFHLRNEKKNLEGKFDHLRAHLDLNENKTLCNDYTKNLIDSLKNLIDSINQRIEAVEIVLLRYQKLCTSNDIQVKPQDRKISNTNKTSPNVFNYYDGDEVVLNRNNKIKFINTLKLAQQVVKFLDANQISRAQFLKTLFVKDSSTSYLNSLLSHPLPWKKLKEGGKTKYIKIKRFMENEEEVTKFLAANKYDGGSSCNVDSLLFSEEQPPVMPAPTVLSQTSSFSHKSTSRLISNALAKEFRLPLDIIDQLKYFLEKYKISQDVFARVVLDLSQRQLRYLFEKLEGISNPSLKSGKFSQGLSPADKLNLAKLGLWFNENEQKRLKYFEILKEDYYKNYGTSATNRVDFGQTSATNTGVQKSVKFYNNEPKSSSLVETPKPAVTEPRLSTTQQTPKPALKAQNLPLKKLELLINYYKANNYPNDEEYESISKICGLNKDLIVDIFEDRQKRFPLHAITRLQYRQLIDYFYSVTRRPTAFEVEKLSRTLKITDNYIQKWFSKQRQNAIQLTAFLKRFNNNNNSVPQVESKTEAVEKNVEEVEAPVVSVHEEPKRPLLPEFENLNETQLTELEDAYNETEFPNEDIIESLADQLNMSMDQIWNWFKVKRQHEETLNKENDSESDSDETEANTEQTNNLCNQSMGDINGNNETFQIEYEYDDI